MKIAIPRELRDGETRVAASPDTVKRFVALGATVVIESGAGLNSGMTDEAYKTAGADIAGDAAATWADAAIVLKVQRPIDSELGYLGKSSIVVATFDALRDIDGLKAVAGTGATAFAMELMPRITRAQSMDVLSSQANLAGYKAVIDAAEQYVGCFPMLMTAAGKIDAAKVLVMGAGVAGLQAIATARRLGGIVSATDVRPAAKEQVESLGAKFVAVEDEEFKQAETAGGYAKEMSAEYQKKQAALIAETISKMDVVITTAQIPGRPAPRLISAEMVASMHPGAVLVDLAVESGGNVEGSEPGQIVEKNGVKIVGHRNVPGRLPAVASQAYSRNLYNFAALFVHKEKGLEIDWDDELIKGTLVAKEGDVPHQMVRERHGMGEMAPAAAPAAASTDVSPAQAGADAAERLGEVSGQEDAPAETNDATQPQSNTIAPSTGGTGA